MSKAREIAEERFAMGEITEAELKDILSKLPSTQTSSNNTKEKKSGKVETFFKSIGLAVGVFLILSFLGSLGEDGDSDNFVTANLKHENGFISIDVTNSGSKSGDVLIWATTPEKIMESCLHVFRMKPGTIRGLSFRCDPPSGPGATFLTRMQWADNKKAKAQLAKRIKVNW